MGDAKHLSNAPLSDVAAVVEHEDFPLSACWCDWVDHFQKRTRHMNIGKLQPSAADTRYKVVTQGLADCEFSSFDSSPLETPDFLARFGSVIFLFNRIIRMRSPMLLFM